VGAGLYADGIHNGSQSLAVKVPSSKKEMNSTKRNESAFLVPAMPRLLFWTRREGTGRTRYALPHRSGFGASIVASFFTLLGSSLCTSF